MKQIDVKFSPQMIQLLQQIIGAEFIKFRTDPFVFSNSVFERIGIFTNQKVLLLENALHVVDYYGADEDICLLGIKEVPESDIISALENVKQVDTMIHRKIKEIQIVNEEQIMYENKMKIYDVHFTRGLNFILTDDHEIAFEKTNPFVETIAISQGSHLVSGFISLSSTLEDVEPPYSMEGYRTIERITSSGISHEKIK